jgi:uncharacterized repeat protein (TIGR03803 family)
MVKSVILLSSTMLLAAYSYSASASASEEAIYSYPVGSQPTGQLVQDKQGAIYGVSIFGGTKNDGFVSELTQKRGVWKGRTIHDFSGVDGANPAAALEIDPDTGVLYGTTRYGGIGWGTVFSLAPNGRRWNEDVLHDFTADLDGDEPDGKLYLDKTNGVLLGTASSNVTGNPSGCGDAFELTQSGGSWSFSSVYEFQGGADGCIPETGVRPGIEAGTYFGTTSYNTPAPNKGTVYQLINAGGSWSENVIGDFPKTKDGSFPTDLVFVSDDLIYGTASESGAHGSGVVFELKHNHAGWKETVLNSFNGSNGNGPVGLLYDSKNNVIYGTTALGGSFNGGVLFELTPSGKGWTETVLHSFGASGDGANPTGRPIQDHRTGVLYGATSKGGQNNSGVVYSY